ncbi:MAG: XRE family transcriptional regulator [Proteobacteria bacterium]|nr:XRE family transcriptional regulator [Pseudomonadota bacterium]
MPNINHKILSWAREIAELSVEKAASKLQIKDGKTAIAKNKLLAYENGTVSPSRSMLLRMSKTYRQPILTFYLDKPPRIGDRGEDFRTLPDHFEEENAYVDVLIRDIKARQSIARETLIDENEEFIVEFIGKSRVDQGIEHISQVLRKVLKLNIDEFRSQSNYGDAFKYLRHRAEDIGIFVLLQGNLGSHHTNISVTAFRGFALSDDIAPFIIINDQDAKSAWSFTLLHEMAHLALGQTGVSGAYVEKKIEKFCNDVASEVLLPAVEFEDFQPYSLYFENIREEINDYAFSKKISSSHIAYRLYRVGIIDKNLWTQLSKYYHQQWNDRRDKEKLKSKQRDGGPNYYVVKRYKLGALVSLVQRFAYSGAVSTTKAGLLLNIKPLKVHRLFGTNQIV